MRSQRLQKKIIRDEPIVRTNTSDLEIPKNDGKIIVKCSKYEYMKSISIGNKGATDENPSGENWISINSYDIDDITNKKGVKEVEEFSEELRYMRRECIKNKSNNTITLKLAYEKDKDDENKYKCIIIEMKYNTSGEEKVNIKSNVKDGVNQECNLYIKDLDVDSDVTEYLYRFTKGLDWGSETYAILDCNPNLSVEKGIYLTLNTPFNRLISWGDTKRRLIIAYQLNKS